MCGDLEEDGPGKLEDMLYSRFLGSVQSILDQHKRQAAPDDPVVAAIDKLFTDALSRAASDSEAAPDERNYDMMSMQPLVFARLAGFMAAHLSLHEDPLRKVMEALMHGYAEAESMERDHGHDHDHAHGHHHHHH